MKTFLVVFAPRAIRDPEALSAYITAAAGPMTAQRYIARLKSFCLALDVFPQRGERRTDGSRTLGFERSATVRFTVEEDAVVIATIAYRGRDLRKEPT